MSQFNSKSTQKTELVKKLFEVRGGLGRGSRSPCSVTLSESERTTWYLLPLCRRWFESNASTHCCGWGLRLWPWLAHGCARDARGCCKGLLQGAAARGFCKGLLQGASARGCCKGLLLHATRLNARMVVCIHGCWSVVVVCIHGCWSLLVVCIHGCWSVLVVCIHGCCSVFVGMPALASRISASSALGLVPSAPPCPACLPPSPPLSLLLAALSGGGGQ